MTELPDMAAETDRFFREIVLCLGGIFAAQKVDDAVVWQVTESLERIYERARERTAACDGHPDLHVFPRRAEPHLAVAELLTRIG